MVYFRIFFLSTKCNLFANYCLVKSLFFQIKNSGFHLKEEGKELLGMLMTSLANNNGYCVLYLSAFCQKMAGLFAKCVNCYFQIKIGKSQKSQRC